MTLIGLKKEKNLSGRLYEVPHDPEALTSPRGYGVTSFNNNVLRRTTNGIHHDADRIHAA